MTGVRVTKRRAQTRARMVAAARQVCCHRGFGHVTIDDVCEAAGYSRGAFYSQFANLEDLFFVLYDEWASVAENGLCEAVACSQPDSVQAVVDLLVENLSWDRTWLAVKQNFLLHASYDSGVGERYERHRARVCALIENLLSRSGIAGALGDGDTAHAVVAAFDGIGMSFLLDSDLAGARRKLGQLLAAVLAADSSVSGGILR